MKNCSLVLLLFCCFCSARVAAQETPAAIRFTNGDFVTGGNILRQSFKAADLAAASFADRYFVAIQFSGLPSAAVQDNLKRAGVELYNYLPGKAYFASIRKDFNFSSARLFNISSVNVVQAFYKIDQQLAKYKPASGKEQVQNIAVDYFGGLDKQVVIAALKKAGATIVSTRFDATKIIFIQYDVTAIANVAQLPFVSGISLQSIVDKPLNYNSIGAHGISGLNAPGGKNLQGRGIVIGIGDNADISTHTDFTGRIISRTPWIPQDHGTHVSGTAAGAGIINVKNHGMAPHAVIINQYFSDILVNAPAYITDNNMVVTNNSYYSVEVGCVGNGRYDVLSNYVDAQLKDYPQLMNVIASGNDGTYNCNGYPLAFATVKSGWQTAKNVLTVGAIKAEDYDVAYFTSRGPVRDGRLKPEISAAGWAIMSTNANDTYGLNFGTSMASPVVSGTLSLMYERYRQTHAGADPKGSLMKTLVCNTAEDLGNAGPDFTYGFGMLNARRAVEAIDSNRYIINTIANAGNTAHVITVPANTRRLKVMLYWADQEAAVNAVSALVNDLDLTVSTPANATRRPLVLNPSPALVEVPAVEGVDHTNNIEQVVIDNPAAGSYTIRVNGFHVPAGTQEYIISYELDKPSVTVEYPCGGEKLVPGETENLRWTAYGNESNTFKAEYSANNGVTWSLIQDNISSSARTIAWTVPTNITNIGIIRISRNGTALTGQSRNNFTVLQSPVITTQNICEGAVQVNWGAVSGATSYDVLQLMGDSMQVVGNTTGLTFLIKGLNKNQKAWFGVAARNGIVSGRRSISVSAIPNSGACTLATFNNDVKVDTILEPISARKGFITEPAALKPVKIQVRNTGAVAVTGPFTLAYSYAGNTVTEVLNTTIGAGASITYTFTGLYTVVASGFRYDFKSWVSYPADGNHLNDTAYKAVKYINNDAITSLPLTEGFETMNGNDFRKAEMAIGDNKFIDFSTNTVRGRARSFVNTGFAYSGTKALTLDQVPYNDVTSTNSITLSYNLINYNNKQLRFDFYYKNHGQADAPGNKIWIRGSENNVWLQAYDLFANQAALSDWKHGNININEILNGASPVQTITPTFQIRIGQEGNNSANTSNAVIDLDDGYTFDDLVLNEATNDVAVTKINSPDVSDCALSASNPIGIRLRNYNNTTLNNVPVSYQVNGGSKITELITLTPNQTLDYVFTQRANLSAYIDYTINVWVKYPVDSYSPNDSILNFLVHNSPVISSYPYLQSFEANNGSYYARGTNSTWQWGTPANVVINKAANGDKAWVTGLTTNYKDNETSYLYSPCFDIAGLSQPMLSFSHIFQIEKDYDYSWVEYSLNGVTWQKLGAVNSGTNWYDNTDLVNWSISATRWHVASIALPVVPNIRFRFIMSSDGGVTEEGIGIDDIHVFNRIPVYEGVPVTNITQTVSGSNWVDFLSGGNRVVSLNANGSNLGVTSAQVFPFTGAVRNSNNTYYANRNIVVKPANAPNGNVGVRFYFTETEALALINAAGCDLCSLPIDPYELGVVKYSGTRTEENGILEDDLLGLFKYINADSVTIVPYDNGYYAEFNVPGFSEFWLSTDNIKPVSNGACVGEDVVLKAAAVGTSYQWQEDRGAGFINIGEDFYYAGINTETLVLSFMPTSFSGYKYRCVVNGVAGAATTIRFTNAWNGSVSNNWFVADNWSCGVVPDQNTDVIIPGGLTTYPLVNANAAVRRLSAQQGATVTLAAGVKLDVQGK